MSFVATGVGAGSLAALGTSGLIAATPALATAGGLGTAGALTGAGGGLLSSTLPAAYHTAAASMTPAVSQGGGVYTGGFNSLRSGRGPTQIPKASGMFDGLGGAIETGLENLNKVAQPAANISQAVSPFMSEEQPIQASPIAPPTYSNNLNELVAQNEQTDQQRMQDEMMRRMEQRKKIQDLALGGVA